jgi:spermidine/putrescine transport system permease protein
MIYSLPSSKSYKIFFGLYIFLFFTFLFLPLIVISVLAFNNSDFISLPWHGFTLDWFFANTDDRTGLFFDDDLLRSIWISIKTAFFVSIFSTIVGIIAALLFEEEDFKGKKFFYFLALSPLVIPGVILGIAILMASTTLKKYIEQNFGLDLESLNPGFWLVVIGQFAFCVTYVMLIVGARLKKFDRTLEEAALSLKASRIKSIWHITIPFLKPAIINAFIVVFLISFSNFNTTIFLIGSDPTLPVEIYSRIKYSSTPVLNAVSFLIVLIITIIAFFNLFISKKNENNTSK